MASEPLAATKVAFIQGGIATFDCSATEFQHSSRRTKRLHIQNLSDAMYTMSVSAYVRCFVPRLGQGHHAMETCLA